MHIGKDIIILGKSPTQGLDDTTLTAEAQHSINFSRSTRKFCLCLHYIGSSSFVFVNATKLIQFTARDSEIKKPFCLGNISGDFLANNMKKTRLNRYVYDFSVDCRSFDTSNIIDIHKILMKNHDIKKMLRLIKKNVYGIIN